MKFKKNSVLVVLMCKSKRVEACLSLCAITVAAINPLKADY